MYRTHWACFAFVLLMVISPAMADEFSNDDIRHSNAIKVCERAAAMATEERFEFLTDHVLKTKVHLSWIAVSTQHHYELACPAAEMVKVAHSIGKLDQLRDRIAEYPVVTKAEKMNSAVALLLLELADENSPTAVQHATKVEALVSGTLVADEMKLSFFLAAWFARQSQPTRDIFGSMLRDEHVGLLQSQQDSIDHQWANQISALNGLYQYLASNQPKDLFGQPPQRQHWFPATIETEMNQLKPQLPTHWKSFAAQVECLSSQNQNLLFYRLPLQGDFEVSCEMTDYAFARICLLYGGEWIVPKQYRATFVSGDLRSSRNDRLPAALKKPEPWVRYNLIVRDGICRICVNGRHIHERRLSVIHDPWLAIRCATPFHGAVRNLRILGSPDVPETVSLISSTGLQGWVPWFRDNVGSATAEWRTQQGDGSGPVLIGRRRDELQGTGVESLLTFQRPMAEDGVIRYEFYYEPDVHHAYPALGRTAFLFRPNGVQIHDVAHGPSTTPMSAEQILPSGIVGLLAANQWNRVALKLTGDVVQISLNDQPVCEYELPADNPRTFGVFYFPDQAQLQIRKLHWRGDWSTRLPSVWQQELAGDDLESIDKNRDRLSAVFAHDFAADGLSEKFFATTTNGSGSTTNTAVGVMTTVASPAGYRTTKLLPNFEIHGDFDVTASFQNFSGTGANEKAARIDAVINGETFSTAIDHQTDFKAGFKSIRIEKQPDGKQKSTIKRMNSEAVSGRLRLTRRGDIITSAFAEGDSVDFHFIQAHQASPLPIAAGGLDLRVFAGPGSQASIVWTDLKIYAEKLASEVAGR